ncbi:hypothetical protein [Bartonella sp. Raccoon60]|uniref:hypothetical protein n=1 Tax=Bartonella sp. Raccoon60 TaxID=1933912 RepID=UPI0009C29F8B|nr:hypothetical protein [Bartonella sp. Raccoon60]AQX27274.1 hypothetical protein Bra60_013050 [Bartonella sp. Raccoon60]
MPSKKRFPKFEPLSQKKIASAEKLLQKSKDSIPSPKELSSKLKDSIPSPKELSSKLKDGIPLPKELSSKLKDSIPSPKELSSKLKQGFAIGIEKTKYLCVSAGGNSKLCRIVAVKSFGDVTEGDLGGFIENESNLSQQGDC